MIHEWFISFGWIAALLIIVPAFLIRFISKKVNPNPNSDERQGRAFGFFFFLAIAAVAWFVGFILLLAGIPAAIAGWIGCAFIGIAFGVVGGSV